MEKKLSYMLLVHWRDCYCEDHDECVVLEDDEPATILAALAFIRDRPDSGFLNFTARSELFVRQSEAQA